MRREAKMDNVIAHIPPSGTVFDDAAARASDLKARYGDLDGLALMRVILKDELPGRIALVSSFGAESAVLLAMGAEIDPGTPVIFIDTGKLFGETRTYRDKLVKTLGLTNVQTYGPDWPTETAQDPLGALWRSNPDACCGFRKVEPLARALKPYAGWITGRKRFQSATRAALPTIEFEDTRLKINPLANWSAKDLAEEFKRRDLPRHPLVADGYLSIGCMPCTDRVAPGADPRSGRWAGLDKTECGIHVARIPAKEPTGLDRKLVEPEWSV
jgi:phosphoadenosine phosphosulfate reductase